MPTGVHLLDARRQLFDAAERILLAAGPSALTSRSVTDEANVAKGVLHRHFADFDTFLVELIMDRAAGLEVEYRALLNSVGTGSVVQNVVNTLSSLFSPVPSSIIPLTTFRDDLRARLRLEMPGGGIGILAQGTAAIGSYLSAERERGRISNNVDIPSLTLSLVGGGHLLATDTESAPPTTEQLQRFVRSSLAGALVSTAATTN